MMEAVSTCEAYGNFYMTTVLIIPEDSHLHTRFHENLKSHKLHVGGKQIWDVGTMFCMDFLIWLSSGCR
jgi:hypothetical protein